MPELIPLKVIIKKKSNGFLDYPNFKNTLPVFNNPDYQPPKIYLDRTSDCSKNSSHSPEGQMLGLKLVDREFAAQAIEQYPDRCSIMTEEELEDFWDNKVMFNMLENKYDLDILNGLKLEYELNMILKQSVTDIENKIAIAINENNDNPGIIKNKEKKWSDYKQLKNISIIQK